MHYFLYAASDRPKRLIFLLFIKRKKNVKDTTNKVRHGPHDLRDVRRSTLLVVSVRSKNTKALSKKDFTVYQRGRQRKGRQRRKIFSRSPWFVLYRFQSMTDSWEPVQSYRETDGVVCRVNCNALP